MAQQHRDYECDVLVIGSGVAGMATALELTGKKVVLLSKTPGLPGGSSRYAQGGIAAAIGEDDTPQEHEWDTLSAGAGLSEGSMVKILTEEGPRALYRLIEHGMTFDCDATGSLSPQKEAAHGKARVLHAQGDATGAVMVETLVAAVKRNPHIEVHCKSFAWDLLQQEGQVSGALAWQEESGWVRYRAQHVVLACGGIGQVFGITTNPAESTGDGLAMALRAGAVCADLEMIQFHPTAMAAGRGPAGNVALLTEALRGEGAQLFNQKQQRFMLTVHPDAELAPRDIVARAVWKEISSGNQVFLDATKAVGSDFPHRFPTVYRLCRQQGFDPIFQAIPVAPAMHYHMGGVLTDAHGRTNIKGLWACGESASTGVHGANRLASNSLLECLVFAGRVAQTIGDTPVQRPGQQSNLILPGRNHSENGCKEAIQRVLYRAAGLVRNEEDMQAGRLALNRINLGGASMRELGEARNMKLVGQGILTAALSRRESRGAHFREDFPETKPHWAQRLTMTLEEINGMTAVPEVAQTA